MDLDPPFYQILPARSGRPSSVTSRRILEKKNRRIACLIFVCVSDFQQLFAVLAARRHDYLFAVLATYADTCSPSWLPVRRPIRRLGYVDGYKNNMASSRGVSAAHELLVARVR